MFSGILANVYGKRQAGWQLIGSLSNLCSDDQQALAKGDVSTTPSLPHNDVTIGGRRFVMQETHVCSSK